MLSSSPAFQHSCNFAFLHSCNPAGRITCNLLILKYGLTVCLPTFKHKEPINFIRLYRDGSVWHLEVAFGTVTQCNTFINRSLICIIIFINGFMRKSLTYLEVTGTTSSRFSLLHSIRPAGRIFVFTRTRQVVF